MNSYIFFNAKKTGEICGECGQEIEKGNVFINGKQWRSIRCKCNPETIGKSEIRDEELIPINLEIN